MPNITTDHAITYTNPRQSWIRDSTSWSPDFRYWIPDYLPVELGSRTPVVSEIPDSSILFFLVLAVFVLSQNGFLLLKTT